MFECRFDTTILRGVQRLCRSGQCGSSSHDQDTSGTCCTYSFSNLFVYSRSPTNTLEQVPSHPGFLLQKATRRRVLLARLVYDELSNVTTKEIEKFISNSVYASSAKELMSFFEDSVKKEVDIPSKILNEAICVDKVGGDDSTREQRIQKTDKAQTLLRLLISLLVPRKQSNAVLGSILKQILTHTTEILENLVTDTVTKHSVCDVDVANVCSMIPFVSDVIVLLSVHSQDTAALRCALPAISKLLSTLSRARGLFPSELIQETDETIREVERASHNISSEESISLNLASKIIPSYFWVYVVCV